MTARPDNADRHDTHLLDVRGMASPESLIFVAKATRYLSRGTRVNVSGNKPTSLHDLPVWAEWSGHEVWPSAPDPDGGSEGFAITLVVHGGRTPHGAPRPDGPPRASG